MERQSACRVIIVDWDAKQYTIVDPSTDDENLVKQVCAERKKGRDVHCFSHDPGDMSGLTKWASQHKLAQTDMVSLMSTT